MIIILTNNGYFGNELAKFSHHVAFFFYLFKKIEKKLTNEIDHEVIEMERLPCMSDHYTTAIATTSTVKLRIHPSLIRTKYEIFQNILNFILQISIFPSFFWKKSMRKRSGRTIFSYIFSNFSFSFFPRIIKSMVL